MPRPVRVFRPSLVLDDLDVSPEALRAGRLRLRLPARDGRCVVIRPVRADDKPYFVDGLTRLSPQSRQFRFLAGVGAFTGEQLQFLTEVDQSTHVCLVATDGSRADDDPQGGLGVVRFSRGDNAHAADLAVTVVDAWQHRGIGSLMFEVARHVALRHGVSRFEGDVASDNVAAREWFLRLGGRLRPGPDGWHLRLPLA